MDLNGKIAIVTGGAMGNGLGIVKTFLQSPELSPPYAQTRIGTKEDGNYRKYKK